MPTFDAGATFVEHQKELGSDYPKVCKWETLSDVP
jgi:hypothetical protein